MEVDNHHLHHIMLYKFREGKSASRATVEIQSVYGERVLSLNQVKDCFLRFESGDFTVIHERRQSSFSDNLIKKLDNCINKPIQQKENRLNDDRIILRDSNELKYNIEKKTKNIIDQSKSCL